MGIEANYQSVLNIQLGSEGYFAVNEDHIQLLHSGHNHWLTSFISADRVQVCESLHNSLTEQCAKSLKQIYKKAVQANNKLPVTLLPVQQQNDGASCGVMAIAFAVEVLFGFSPIEVLFDSNSMWQHLIKCLEAGRLTHFPQAGQIDCRPLHMKFVNI